MVMDQDIYNWEENNFYGYIQRMKDNRLVKNDNEMATQERRKRGRTTPRWNQKTLITGKLPIE